MCKWQVSLGWKCVLDEEQEAYRQLGVRVYRWGVLVFDDSRDRYAEPHCAKAGLRARMG